MGLPPSLCHLLVNPVNPDSWQLLSLFSSLGLSVTLPPPSSLGIPSLLPPDTPPYHSIPLHTPPAARSFDSGTAPRNYEYRPNPLSLLRFPRRPRLFQLSIHRILNSILSSPLSPLLASVFSLLPPASPPAYRLLFSPVLSSSPFSFLRPKSAWHNYSYLPLKTPTRRRCRIDCPLSRLSLHDHASRSLILLPRPLRLAISARLWNSVLAFDRPQLARPLLSFFSHPFPSDFQERFDPSLWQADRLLGLVPDRGPSCRRLRPPYPLDLALDLALPLSLGTLR